METGCWSQRAGQATACGLAVSDARRFSGGVTSNKTFAGSNAFARRQSTSGSDAIDVSLVLNKKAAMSISCCGLLVFWLQRSAMFPAVGREPGIRFALSRVAPTEENEIRTISQAFNS